MTAENCLKMKVRLQYFLTVQALTLKDNFGSKVRMTTPSDLQSGIKTHLFYDSSRKTSAISIITFAWTYYCNKIY